MGKEGERRKPGAAVGYRRRLWNVAARPIVRQVEEEKEEEGEEKEEEEEEEWAGRLGSAGDAGWSGKTCARLLCCDQVARMQLDITASCAD